VLKGEEEEMFWKIRMVNLYVIKCRGVFCFRVTRNDIDTKKVKQQDL
jgi:hypothetical protein